MKCCVLHSSNSNTTEVAEKIVQGLQQKLPSGYSSARFQLQDETNAQDACREIDGVECAVVLLDDDFLSILDHRKSKRLYAKIADMLKPGCPVTLLFINVGVGGSRLDDFKEDFENQDKMYITNYTTSEEICNYCYRNFVAVCGPTESEEEERKEEKRSVLQRSNKDHSMVGTKIPLGSRLVHNLHVHITDDSAQMEPLTAENLNSGNMNSLNVRSFLSDDASNGHISGASRPLCSAHINTRQLLPHHAVENTYSSGSTAESTSNHQESYGRQLDSGELFCVNKASPQSLPAATLASKQCQTKVPGESSSSSSMPDALIVTGQSVSSPSKFVGQASDHRLPSTYGRNADLPNFSQLRSDITSGLQYVDGRHGNQILMSDNNCYQQHQSQGAVYQDPHRNENLQGNQTDFIQNHPSQQNPSPGHVFQNMPTNTNLQFNQQGLDQRNQFQSPHQNLQLLQPFQPVGQGTDSHMNYGHGHRLGGNFSHPVGHIPQQERSLPYRLPSESSTSSSNVTSYVQAGYSLPQLYAGFCSLCKRHTEIVMNIPVAVRPQEFSSMHSHPSFGPQAMPCLSGFGICEQCVNQSMQQGLYGSGNLPTFQTDMLKSILESEERDKPAGSSTPNSRIAQGSNPSPNTAHANVTASTNNLSSQMAALNIQPNHVPPSQSTPRLQTQHSESTDVRRHGVGSSERQTLSLPSSMGISSRNTDTARSQMGLTGNERSTVSMPDILPHLQVSSFYPSGSFFESVTDNTKLPGGIEREVTEERKKKRDYGTNTNEDEQSLGASGGGGGSYHRDDGSGAENQVSIFELSKPIFSYIRDLMDSSEQYNWTDLATLHGWNYGQIYALRQKFKKGMISSPFEHLMEEFQNYTVQQLKEDLIKIPRRDVLEKLRRYAQQGKLPANCAGLFT